MGIPPIGAVGTSPVIYNVRKTNTPVRLSADTFEKSPSITLNNTLINDKEKNSRKRFDTVEFSSDEPPQDFKAINLIKKSVIPPPDIDSSDKSIQDVNYADKDSKISQTENEIKLIENSATFKTSDEVAKESSPSRLTPSQQQGIEIYQRFQNYLSPINLSNARIAV